jgi:7-cyano-7-deazaguanine synthase in queuosine biosynthesis
MIDSVAIVSGDVDSITLLHYLVKSEQKHPAILSFSYEQKHKLRWSRKTGYFLGIP